MDQKSYAGERALTPSQTKPANITQILQNKREQLIAELERVEKAQQAFQKVPELENALNLLVEAGIRHY